MNYLEKTIIKVINKLGLSANSNKSDSTDSKGTTDSGNNEELAEKIDSKLQYVGEFNNSSAINTYLQNSAKKNDVFKYLNNGNSYVVKDTTKEFPKGCSILGTSIDEINEAAWGEKVFEAKFDLNVVPGDQTYSFNTNLLTLREMFQNVFRILTCNNIGGDLSAAFEDTTYFHYSAIQMCVIGNMCYVTFRNEQNIPANSSTGSVEIGVFPEEAITKLPKTYMIENTRHMEYNSNIRGTIQCVNPENTYDDNTQPTTCIIRTTIEEDGSISNIYVKAPLNKVFEGDNMKYYGCLSYPIDMKSYWEETYSTEV